MYGEFRYYTIITLILKGVSEEHRQVKKDTIEEVL